MTGQEQEKELQEYKERFDKRCAAFEKLPKEEQEKMLSKFNGFFEKNVALAQGEKI